MAFFTCFTHWNDYHWNNGLSFFGSKKISIQPTSSTNQPSTSSISSTINSPTITTKSGNSHRTISFTILHGTFSNEEDEETTNNHEDFMNDLYKAQLDKLGMMIPKEQAKQAAQALENEFLSAMKQASQRFDEAKKKYGSEGAIQKWKEEWDENEELVEQDEEEFEIDLDDEMFQ
jgi:hypothetical protein